MPLTIAARIRDRAESYSRDARSLRAEGDRSMAAAYSTIATELRAVADEADRLTPPIDEASQCAAEDPSCEYECPHRCTNPGGHPGPHRYAYEWVD